LCRSGKKLKNGGVESKDRTTIIGCEEMYSKKKKAQGDKGETKRANPRGRKAEE